MRENKAGLSKALPAILCEIGLLQTADPGPKQTYEAVHSGSD